MDAKLQKLLLKKTLLLVLFIRVCVIEVITVDYEIWREK